VTPRYGLIHTAVALTLLAIGSAAVACSLDMRPTWERVNSIRQDRELIRVRGVYRLEEVRGEPLNDPERPGWVRNGVMIGRVALADGRMFRTHHAAPNTALEEELTCVAITYQLPRGNTNRAIFYISRRQRDGRQELVHMDALTRSDRFRTRP
jgi:hypothetical protein